MPVCTECRRLCRLCRLCSCSKAADRHNTCLKIATGSLQRTDDFTGLLDHDVAVAEAHQHDLLYRTLQLQPSCQRINNCGPVDSDRACQFLMWR